MSWIMAGGRLWEIVSFLPGHAIGWAPIPPTEEVGALTHPRPAGQARVIMVLRMSWN
jgi:hypothetical protein